MIWALLLGVATSSSIDCVVFANLAPELQKRLHWTQDQYWCVSGAFSAAYALSLLIAPRLLGLLGLRWGVALGCAVWTLASMCHALVGSVAGFVVVRVLLALGQGIGLSAAITAAASCTSTRAGSLPGRWLEYGRNLGSALVPLGAPLVLTAFSTVAVAGRTLGWRGAFLVTGLFDIAWIIAWLLVYRPPLDKDRSADRPEESAAIQSPSLQSRPSVFQHRLFSLRQTWVLAGASLLTDSCGWFFWLGLPCFFADRFKLSLSSRRWPLVAIFLLAPAGSFAGRRFSAHLGNIGWSRNRARWLTLFICAACMMPVVFASLTSNPWAAAALVSLAMSAHQAWSANLRSLAAGLLPTRFGCSVTRFLGVAGSAGASVLFFIAAYLRESAIARGDPGDYFAIFLAAGFSGLAALLLLRLFMPRLDDLGLGPDSR